MGGACGSRQADMVAPGGSLEAKSSTERGGQTRLGHVMWDPGYLRVEKRAQEGRISWTHLALPLFKFLQNM